MWCNQIFSYIHNNTVKKVVVCDNYTKANRMAVKLYGEGVLAIDTTYYPVKVGDIYEDNKFYRINKDNERTEIKRNNTEQEDIIELKNENQKLKETVTALTAFAQNQIMAIPVAENAELIKQCKVLIPEWNTIEDGTQLVAENDINNGIGITKIRTLDGNLYQVKQSHKKQKNENPETNATDMFSVI